MSYHSTGNLGRLCPACSAPVRQVDTTCPRCGRSLNVPPELNCSLMTPFGWGLCSLVGGSIAGFALATSLRLPNPFRLGALMAIAWLIVAPQIGKRLEPHLRCSYEHLLISSITGGIALQFVTFFYPLPLETALLLWLFAVGASYSGMRRWGYRMPG